MLAKSQEIEMLQISSFSQSLKLSWRHSVINMVWFVLENLRLNRDKLEFFSWRLGYCIIFHRKRRGKRSLERISPLTGRGTRVSAASLRYIRHPFLFFFPPCDDKAKLGRYRDSFPMWTVIDYVEKDAPVQQFSYFGLYTLEFSAGSGNPIEVS